MAGIPNPMLWGGADPLDEYSKVERSVRHRGGASPYWSRNFGAPTNQDKWTLAVWVKRGMLGTQMANLPLISLGGSETTCRFVGYGAPADADKIEFRNAAAIVHRTPSMWRDTSAHALFLLSYDKTLGSNNLTFEVDGNVVSNVSYTSSTGLNSAVLHYIGAAHGLAAGYFFDGNLSRYCFVDGQKLTSAAFGRIHQRTGQFRPISKGAIRAAVAAGGGPRNGWGANGFFLPFDDTTSLTTLGYDRSQSDTDTTGNNWTAMNISLTAGATYDSMLDTPTNNFCTWNPLIPGDSTKSNGNLDAAGAARGTMNASSIPCQWEITANAASVVAGVVSDTGTANTVSVPNGSTYAFRLSSGALEYTSNGSSWSSIATGLTGARFPYASGGANTLNCGQRPLAHPLSGGYGLLCTKTLPIRPAVMKSSDAFVAVTDSGANIVSALAAAAPWPDWIRIIKRRDAAEGWRWIFYDDPTNYLDTSTTNAKAAVPAFAGTSYVGYSLKVSAANGVATGTFVHVNGVASVISDGLSNARKMVILHRESAGGGAFYAYHPDLTAGKLLYLNTTNGETTDASINTVTAGGFTAAAALPSGTYRWISIADMAGGAALRRYDSNNNSDGTFINCDQSIELAFIKTYNKAGNWFAFDSKRNPTNVVNTYLMPQSANGDATLTSLDFVSNGVKLRLSGQDPNSTAGDDYVMVSFPAFPFRYANAR